MLYHLLGLQLLGLQLALEPPSLLRTSGSHHELLVPVSEKLSLLLLEANPSAQTALVDAALESTAPIGSNEDDPYGVVLWPAAQVVAQAVAAMGDLRNRTLLELGAGTGLVSLAAAACGADVLATDYREEPLELLRASAARSSAHVGSPLDVDTRAFDIKSSEPLPPANIVAAADLLYLRSTSQALARRCVEALTAPGCECVLVGDLGRPGRAAFLEELRACGVRAEAAAFTPVAGFTPGTARHELISGAASAADGPLSVPVGLMRLVPADLRRE
jgi:predicted nicotinamide N-methyase